MITLGIGIKIRQALGSIMIVFGLSLILIGANQTLIRHQDELASKQLINQNQVLGATYIAKDYSVYVNKVVSHPTDIANSGRRYSADVTLVNTSNLALDYSPGLQLSLVDGTGQIYAPTAKYLADGQTLGGSLAPGQNTTSTIDFDLPQASQPTELQFQEDLTSKVTKIKL